MFSEFLRNIKWENYTSENRQRIQKFKCVFIFYLYSRHNSEIITVHKNCHLRLLRVDSKNPGVWSPAQPHPPPATTRGTLGHFLWMLRKNSLKKLFDQKQK